ncbi:uncharacterized protein [Clytia hemisphaerica]|uniref:Uncharacterized protein n=1 Tax=Clytia hemisphaerica TaxID=252671 RepID=A0A7M5U2F1_9CNID
MNNGPTHLHHLQLFGLSQVGQYALQKLLSYFCMLVEPTAQSEGQALSVILTRRKNIANGFQSFKTNPSVTGTVYQDLKKGIFQNEIPIHLLDTNSLVEILRDIEDFSCSSKYESHLQCKDSVNHQKPVQCCFQCDGHKCSVCSKVNCGKNCCMTSKKCMHKCQQCNSKSFECRDIKYVCCRSCYTCLHCVIKSNGFNSQQELLEKSITLTLNKKLCEMQELRLAISIVHTFRNIAMHLTEVKCTDMDNGRFSDANAPGYCTSWQTIKDTVWFAVKVLLDFLKDKGSINDFELREHSTELLSICTASAKSDLSMYSSKFQKYLRIEGVVDISEKLRALDIKADELLDEAAKNNLATETLRTFIKNKPLKIDATFRFEDDLNFDLRCKEAKAMRQGFKKAAEQYFKTKEINTKMIGFRYTQERPSKPEALLIEFKISSNEISLQMYNDIDSEKAEELWSDIEKELVSKLPIAEIKLQRWDEGSIIIHFSLLKKDGTPWLSEEKVLIDSTLTSISNNVEQNILSTECHYNILNNDIDPAVDPKDGFEIAVSFYVNSTSKDNTDLLKDFNSESLMKICKTEIPQFKNEFKPKGISTTNQSSTQIPTGGCKKEEKYDDSILSDIEMEEVYRQWQKLLEESPTHWFTEEMQLFLITQSELSRKDSKTKIQVKSFVEWIFNAKIKHILISSMHVNALDTTDPMFKLLPSTTQTCNSFLEDLERNSSRIAFKTDRQKDFHIYMRRLARMSMAGMTISSAMRDLMRIYPQDELNIKLLFEFQVLAVKRVALHKFCYEFPEYRVKIVNNTLYMDRLPKSLLDHGILRLNDSAELAALCKLLDEIQLPLRCPLLKHSQIESFNFDLNGDAEKLLSKLTDDSKPMVELPGTFIKNGVLQINGSEETRKMIRFINITNIRVNHEDIESANVDLHYYAESSTIKTFLQAIHCSRLYLPEDMVENGILTIDWSDKIENYCDLLYSLEFDVHCTTPVKTLYLTYLTCFTRYNDRVDYLVEKLNCEIEITEHQVSYALEMMIGGYRRHLYLNLLKRSKLADIAVEIPYQIIENGKLVIKLNSQEFIQIVNDKDIQLIPITSGEAQIGHSFYMTFYGNQKSVQELVNFLEKAQIKVVDLYGKKTINVSEGYTELFRAFHVIPL